MGLLEQQRRWGISAGSDPDTPGPCDLADDFGSRIKTMNVRCQAQEMRRRRLTQGSAKKKHMSEMEKLLEDSKMLLRDTEMMGSAANVSMNKKAKVRRNRVRPLSATATVEGQDVRHALFRRRPTTPQLPKATRLAQGPPEASTASDARKYS